MGHESDFDSTRILWRAGQNRDGGGYPGFKPATTVIDGIMIERDVAMAMRDGVRIFVDIYRPAGGTEIPAIIGWSPYGKHQTGSAAFDRYPNRAGVPKGVPGRWAKFEAPDPEYWCRHGYAVINADARGSWGSEGDLYTIGGKEAEDIHDLIERTGVLPWCSGKVAMSGNSWLAQCQWFAAATRPPHLAAIAPWEGWSDLYRETVAPGGITTAPTNWIDFVWAGLHSSTRVEDCPAMASAYPLWNAYWDEKKARHSQTQVPAYVVASWNSRLHSRGTFEGFKQIGSAQKWLRIHDGWEWPDYYASENVEDLRKFFDHFLKDVDNGWENTPRVRIDIMDTPTSSVHRTETEWPLSRTRHRSLYLDAATGSLATSPVPAEAQTSYDASAGSAVFDFPVDQDTELTGHMSLRLWVEARGNNDMDLFVVVQKIGRDGARVDFRVFGIGWMAEPARGFLRVSHRELDPELSQPGQPWHTHRREELLQPGEVVPVDIEFWPMGCLWRAGERIRLLIAGHPLLHVGNPITGESLTSARNKGDHVIHTGGRFDSHLSIPHIPAKR